MLGLLGDLNGRWTCWLAGCFYCDMQVSLCISAIHTGERLATHTTYTYILSKCSNIREFSLVKLSDRFIEIGSFEFEALAELYQDVSRGFFTTHSQYRFHCLKDNHCKYNVLKQANYSFLNVFYSYLRYIALCLIKICLLLFIINT